MVAWVKDRPFVALVGLLINGRLVSLVWHKRWFCCVGTACSMSSWIEQDVRVAFACYSMTERAGRWLAKQIG